MPKRGLWCITHCRIFAPELVTDWPFVRSLVIETFPGEAPSAPLTLHVPEPPNHLAGGLEG
jgi:hypothetical protein